ncbi:unnamed protein product [Cylicocyclus nassatus]|uniref:BRCT domain-containing protein n=1 Tax=Cylicocyclus nassatus TaxID=53992 RepID=A0AA36DRK7_CYLNA|nr:unnamed protein product [Cylicocyclus nassatus]
MSAPGAPKKPRLSHKRQSSSTFTEVHDENIEPVNVFCVEPNNSIVTSDEAEYFRETFALVNSHGLGAVWISEQTALEVSSCDESFYFLAAFRGPVFEHLKGLGVNLYGAHAVRHTLNIGGALPRWDFPVYSLNLTGACVCFTGLPVGKRDELKMKINYMNGIVSPGLTEKVTHLVTDYCDTQSKKYTEARRMCLPIMSPLWIEKAWEASQKFSLENFTSTELNQRYRTPIFNRMVVTATGIGGDERIDIARLVELNGGRFSGDMKRNECTHLIADHMRGAKYKKAREWGSVKIVRASWLRKSIQAGYVLPEGAFDPERRNRCSTPVLTTRVPEPDELDCSVIPGNGGRLDNSTFNTQISKHNEDPAPDLERTPLTLVRTNIRREGSRHRLTPSIQNAHDPINELDDACLKGDFDFLEGCRVWICGAEQTNLDKWKKILDRSGATRVGGMEAASHIVVVSASTTERARLLQAKSNGAHVIRADWIVACCREKDLISMEEYVWDPEDTILHTGSVHPSNVTGNVETPRRNETAALWPTSAATTSKELVASDYLNLAPVKNSATPDISNLFRYLLVLLLLSTKLHFFRALKFRMWRVTPVAEAQTSKEIRSAGGTVVPSDDASYVHYLVCDHIECGNLPLKGSYDQIVTVFFVKNCLLNNRILKISSHPLYRPIPAVEGSQVFLNTVIVVSCFSEYERLVLSELTKRFGGRVQESLTKRSKGELLAVTHVVGGSEGERVLEARRQNFKVVDPSWIIESIINDKLLKEDHFPLRDEAYASYEGRTDYLWPEAEQIKRRSCVEPADDFSDLIVEELHAYPDDKVTTPRRTGPDVGQTFKTPTVACATSTPSSAVPRTPAAPSDRSLDMKKAFKPRFEGLTQAVENIPSPSTSEAPEESLSESKVGRLLKEAVVKTAAPKRHAKSDPASVSAHISPTSLLVTSSKGLRKPVLHRNVQVVVNEPLSTENPQSSSSHQKNDMMVLRARMTERLERRNQEIARHIADSKGATVTASSTSPDQMIMSRRRKRTQNGDNSGPSAKKTTQSLSPPSPSPDETVQPLIEWEPDIPTRLSSSAILGLKEPSDSTRQTTSESVSDKGQYYECIKEGPLNAERRSIGEVAQERTCAPQAPVSSCLNAASTVATVAASLRKINSEPARVEAAMKDTISSDHPNNMNTRSAPEFGQRTLQSKVGELPETKKMQPLARIPTIKQERISFEFSATTRHFIFTSVVPHEKLRLSNIITRLGGIADAGELSDETTHLICGKLIRGSKLMGCIASGRWVVGSDYIDKSLAAGKWLPEVDFEVGNPERLAGLNLPEREMKLARACRRWRLKLRSNDSSEKVGAFEGWRCILYCSDDKAAGLIPMLRAGGAEVVTRKSNDGAPLVFRPTHAVVCGSSLWNLEELNMLVSVGAKVFQLEFISKYLMEDNVDEETCYHMDYKRILRCPH